ncbi:hypothetical protein ACLQ3C_00740 [Gordonia sp. DT30]|uniref:hypothetical protein n=1 Tax=unclassified Gordonia (in: high G+C Gram-positive bacteria) TaxID=2657482 RepID=UPI003CEB5F33
MRVTGRDRDRDLVAFDGGVARWGPTYGDPRTQPVGIGLSWHHGDVPGVDVTATVSNVRQIYLGTTEDPTTGETLRPVEQVERFPAPLCIPAGALEPGGVVVTLADPVLIEPTSRQVADFRSRRELARRTIFVTFPATYFGRTVPRVGDRISIDLDNPTAEISASPSGVDGIAAGVTSQVSEAIPYDIGPAGIVTYRTVQAGIPTLGISHDLFVALILDEPS